MQLSLRVANVPGLDFKKVSFSALVLSKINLVLNEGVNETPSVLMLLQIPYIKSSVSLKYQLSAREV